jgi:hypothetical protein
VNSIADFIDAPSQAPLGPFRPPKRKTLRKGISPSEKQQITRK